MLNWLWERLFGCSFDEASKELHCGIDSTPGLSEAHRLELHMAALGYYVEKE